MITPQMTTVLAYLAHINGWLVDGLFAGSLILATVAQVMAYRSGCRNYKRYAAMWCGIIAVFLLFAAGQIAGAKLTNYVNSRGAPGAL
jgi:hypothetical protein